MRDLYALKRPDWREQLQYWAERIDQELSSQKTPKAAKTSPISVLTLENPVWSHRLIDSDLLLPRKGRQGGKDRLPVLFLQDGQQLPDRASRS